LGTPLIQLLPETSIVIEVGMRHGKPKVRQMYTIQVVTADLAALPAPVPNYLFPKPFIVID